jgi:metal-responsive CopG/Arc/MetJ family transcriptional regulator
MINKGDKKMSRKLKLLSMNMPVDLIKQVDDYANRMNLTRTSAITFLVSTALEQKNAMTAVDKLLKKLKDIEVMAKAQK